MDFKLILNRIKGFKILKNYYFLSYLYIFILLISFNTIYAKWCLEDALYNFISIRLIISLYINFVNIRNLNRRKLLVSDLFVALMQFLIIIPSSIIFIFQESFKIEFYLSLNLTLWIIIFFKNINLFKHSNNYKLKFSSKYIERILLFVLLSAVAFLIFTKGFNNFNLNPKLVHNLREIDKSYPIQIYLMSWLSNVIIPLLSCIFIKKKNYIGLLFLSIILVYIFGISFSKTLLAIPIFALSLAALFRNKKISFSIIPIGLIFLNIITLLIHSFSSISSDFEYLTSMVIRRSIFIPSQVIFSYFDFFSQNNFIYWSNTFGLNKFLNYPYDSSVGLLISNNYFNGDGFVNSSFFGTGFMHAGYFGNILYAVVIGLIFNFIDSFSKDKKDKLLYLGCSLTPILILITSADLTTTLISHGLLITLLLIPLISEEVV